MQAKVQWIICSIGFERLLNIYAGLNNAANTTAIVHLKPAATSQSKQFIRTAWPGPSSSSVLGILAINPHLHWHYLVLPLLRIYFFAIFHGAIKRNFHAVIHIIARNKSRREKKDIPLRLSGNNIQPRNQTYIYPYQIVCNVLNIRRRCKHLKHSGLLLC